jgi:hypothetical protein
MKTSNLKIVEQQTKAEQRDKEEESWRLTRAEITARVRAIRAQLEAFRAQLEGVPFDVVTNDMPVSLDYGNRPCPSELAESAGPRHYRPLRPPA